MKKGFILFLSFALIFSNFNIYGSNLNDLNKKKTEIKDKVSDSKKALETTVSEKSEALNQVEKLDNELDKIQNELDKLTVSLEETKKNLEKTEEELKKAEANKVKQYESLKKRLRVMYEYGNESYLEILLESKGFTDFLKRIEYVNRIMEHDSLLLERYKETEKTIAIKVEEIKIQKEDIEKLTKETSSKKSQIESKISSKQKLVSNLRNQEKLLEQQIKDLEKEDRNITALINQAKVKVTGSSNNKIYSTTNGKLAYPVPKYLNYPYNDTYGYRTNPISGRKELHSGLDLKATYGTDIVSAEDGVVIYSGNKGGYGKTVIVDHGNGLTTLYGHNSSLVVSVGQKVKRGQVIAKAGSTGYSTGVHAHFEVRINGKHTDPAPYIK